MAKNQFLEFKNGRESISRKIDSQNIDSRNNDSQNIETFNTFHLQENRSYQSSSYSAHHSPPLAQV